MSEPDPATVWHRYRAELRRAVSDATWHTWLERLSFRDLDGTTLTLDAPDDARLWIRSRFGRLLTACAETTLGSGATVEIVAPQPSEPASAPRPVAHRLKQEFNPRYTFDQFVIGDCNRLAHGAALAVAEMPGLAYNPLFICGPPGLGKTHLLHSIANYVTEHGDGLTVRYTTVEAFTDHFVGALQGGGLESFKAAYRGVGVLLVDDVQFLQSKVKTEQEFFHTFNELHQAGAQLVLTSDRLPRDMDALEDRLRERFEAGLVCDVRPAERATRLTILRKRVAQDDIRDVDPAALDADRGPRDDQHPRARGRADPRRGVRLADRQAGDGGARRRSPRRPLSPVQGATAGPCARSRSRPARRSASRWTSCCPRAVHSLWPGRDRSRCTSRAS